MSWRNPKGPQCNIVAFLQGSALRSWIHQATIHRPCTWGCQLIKDHSPHSSVSLNTVKPWNVPSGILLSDPSDEPFLMYLKSLMKSNQSDGHCLKQKGRIHQFGIFFPRFQAVWKKQHIWTGIINKLMKPPGSWGNLSNTKWSALWWVPGFGNAPQLRK